MVSSRASDLGKYPLLHRAEQVFDAERPEAFNSERSRGTGGRWAMVV